jgi:hypothetical protein
VREGGATAQRRGQTAGLCPRCGAGFDADQEYCLECGLRLPWDSALFAKLTARAAGGRSRGVPRDWVWPALLALVVAAAGAAAAILLTREESSSAAFSVATGGNPPAADSSTLPTPPEPTGAAATGTTSGPRTSPAGRPGLVRWPRGRDGWTIVLVSMPQRGGGAPARAKAQQALTKGLREVGVIDSNRFASLHPGYYVVFTGIYGSPEEAASSLQRAKAAFPLAYTREIAT